MEAHFPAETAGPGLTSDPSGSPAQSGDGGREPSGIDPGGRRRGLGPEHLAYAVGPIALVMVVVLRHFGLVARVSVWAYVGAVAAAGIVSQLVEPWRNRPGRWRLHVRVAIHVSAVTSVIYMSGWGPAVGMAFAFVALEDIEVCGSRIWKMYLWWSVAGIAIGQALVWPGWAPSFLDRTQSMTIGFLGAFVLAIVVQMAGAAGEKKERAEALLAHQALHDPLTGLANRQLLVDRLSHAVELIRRGCPSTAMVMFLDLDRFKLVNDTLGHTAGDDLLIQVAERLRKIVRAADTISRFGGDEFVLLFENVESTEGGRQIVERVRTLFDTPFELGCESLHVGVSIGVAPVDDRVRSTEALLSEADAAMYLAKSQRDRGAVQLFDEVTRRAARQRVNTETALAHALERDQLVVHYQPIVEVANRRMAGVEALLRWNHPERGLLPPGQFLELAEHTGLIIAIGEWVLGESCSTVSRWNRDRNPKDHLFLSVNLSPRQLAKANFVTETASLLRELGVEPTDVRLSFELTESFVPVTEATERARLGQLHQMGIELAIDDFGSGYSSLAYVNDLPISVVKIDRSFVSGMSRPGRSGAIVRGIIELAHNIDLVVVAEGVETEAQLAGLVELGCDYAQGFLLGRPQPADQLFAADLQASGLA